MSRDAVDSTSAESLPLLVVTGGGSGGHTMPALAVARHAESSGLAQVVYIGGSTGIERGMAEEAGLRFEVVRTGKLRRASHWYGLLRWRNVVDILNALLGVVDSLRLLRRLKPTFVLGTGGYVAVPVVAGAFLLRIPTTIHEQTTQLGLANRILAQLAGRVALSSELSLDKLSSRQRRKASVVGNPVRSAVLEGSAARGVERFSLRADLPTLLILGGAHGAEVINRAVLESLQELLAVCNVVHQSGTGAGLTTTTSVLARRREEIGPTQGAYWIDDFLGAETIGDAYAVATLAVSRSGAGATNELAATETPALLVPLVPTGGDEQRKIAERFRLQGAAVVVPSADLDGATLVAIIKELLSEPEKLVTMSHRAGELYPGDATAALVRLAMRAASWDLAAT